MDRKLIWLLLFTVFCAFVAGFCAAMIVAGNTEWECWGYGNNC